MKSWKISAGKVPPKTRLPKKSVRMGIRPLRWPTQTEVASCGVNPENMALV
jgi:hypothetical protein